VRDVLRAPYSGTCEKLAIKSSNCLRKCPLTLDNDIPGLDGDLDPLGDLEQFLGVAVPTSAHVHPNLELFAVRVGGRNWWCARRVLWQESVGSGD
jgi:hypothetical protein